jgi:uncharacterized delta-60 repeat protein
MKKSAKSLVTSLLFLGLSFGTQSAHAAAGSLDPAFGHNGVAKIPFNGVIPFAAKLQADGKIVVYGQQGVGSGFVVRLTTAGLRDKSFGNAGIATPAAPFDGLSASMALQSNGQIVVAGIVGQLTSQPSFAVARLNANGTVDTTFGSGGFVTMNLGFPGTQETVVIQTDGKILLGAQLEPVGRGQPFRMALVRFNSNGTQDASFGSGGTVVVNGIGGCSALALLSDGDILALNSGLIAQFTPTGSLEPMVTGGPITVASSSEEPSVINAFQANGDYLVAQEFSIGAPRDHNDAVQVLRFTSTGTLDPNFAAPIFRFTGQGGTGVVDAPRAMAIQDNGDIVVVGFHALFSQAGSNDLNGLVRLTPDGNFDPTFGNGGIVTNTVPNKTTLFFGVLIQPADGKIVTIGTAVSAIGQPELTVERYLGQ